jgi:hypothetical protein
VYKERDMSEPLYTCSYSTDFWTCAEEACYPKDMLKVHEGKPWCAGCWDEAPAIWVNPDDEDSESVRWDDLEPFVPEHETRIADLTAKLEKV